jgi:hypothetical protein
MSVPLTTCRGQCEPGGREVEWNDDVLFCSDRAWTCSTNVSGRSSARLQVRLVPPSLNKQTWRENNTKSRDFRPPRLEPELVENKIDIGALHLVLKGSPRHENASIRTRTRMTISIS